MEAIYFGSSVEWGHGAGAGPWVMADLENGLWAGENRTTLSNTPLTHPFVFAMVKGGTNGFALKGGDATTGALSLMYDGPRPHGAFGSLCGHPPIPVSYPRRPPPHTAGYQPMKKQGSIILGIGGDKYVWSAKPRARRPHPPRAAPSYHPPPPPPQSHTPLSLLPAPTARWVHGTRVPSPRATLPTPPTTRWPPTWRRRALASEGEKTRLELFLHFPFFALLQKPERAHAASASSASEAQLKMEKLGIKGAPCGARGATAVMFSVTCATVTGAAST